MYKALFRNGPLIRSHTIWMISRRYNAAKGKTEWRIGNTVPASPRVDRKFITKAIVSDQEAQTRRLLAEVGLPWNAACLELPPRMPARTATAKRSTVRRAALTHSSVDRWRVMKTQLQP